MGSTDGSPESLSSSWMPSSSDSLSWLASSSSFVCSSSTVMKSEEIQVKRQKSQNHTDSVRKFSVTIFAGKFSSAHQVVIILCFTHVVAPWACILYSTCLYVISDMRFDLDKTSCLLAFAIITHIGHGVYISCG